MFFVKRQKRGLTFEKIFPSVMGTLSALMGKSTVDALNTNEGMAVFAALVGQPGSGKTPALSFVTRELCSVEKFNGVSNQESLQVNCPTIESLLRIMKRFPSVLCKYDSKKRNSYFVFVELS